MSKITAASLPTWKIPLFDKPQIALICVATHGPARDEPHRVDGYWCIHFYTYHATLVFDGKEHAIHPNYVGILPPGVDTIYSFPNRSTHACAHFAFAGGEKAECVDIPVLQDLGPRFPAAYKDFEEAIAYSRTNAVQADVRLWDILWKIASPPVAAPLSRRSSHPAVLQAAEIIDRRLSEELPVPELARAVDLSHNQLTRLFHTHYGTTVLGYIQLRRASRAEHLLVHSQMPIKTIAALVGVDDTRLFNKLVHRYLGASPSEIRRRGQANDPLR